MRMWGGLSSLPVSGAFQPRVAFPATGKSPEPAGWKACPTHSPVIARTAEPIRQHLLSLNRTFDASQDSPTESSRRRQSAHSFRRETGADCQACCPTRSWVGRAVPSAPRAAEGASYLLNWTTSPGALRTARPTSTGADDMGNTPRRRQPLEYELSPLSARPSYSSSLILALGACLVAVTGTFAGQERLILPAEVVTNAEPAARAI